jgi:hypothetical protein
MKNAQNNSAAQTAVARVASQSDLLVATVSALVTGALIYLGAATYLGVTRVDAARKSGMATEEVGPQTAVFQVPTDGPNGEGVVMVSARAWVGQDGRVIIERLPTKTAASGDQQPSPTLAALPN